MRYLESWILKDLDKKMVFIGGPRQVGKTTLALYLAGSKDESYPGYLNWDRLEHKEKILKNNISWQYPMIIFDEIHKNLKWRNLIKGYYDTQKSKNKIIVTGSARLDYYRKGGDSLLGRYHYYRLHPLSLGELNYDSKYVHVLEKFGGFPEPFSSQSERDWKRWSRERKHLIIRDDLRDLENIKNISQMELLVEILPNKVGSPLSINSLTTDIQASQPTLENWIKILEQLYLCFRIAPYGMSKIKSVKKEKKLYLWDWSQIEDPGARFENMVASQLLKYCHYIEDVFGDEMELRYIRDTSLREIDFVLLKNKKPQFAVECKRNAQKLSKNIFYFKERTKIPEFYQVHLGSEDYGDEKTGCRVIPFHVFCKHLNLP